MRSALVGVLLLSVPAFAYKPPPERNWDFEKSSPDGKFVLVTLRTRDTDLATKYARSGLYPADNPTKSVWTIDWPAKDKQSIFASGDALFAGRVLEERGMPGQRDYELAQLNPRVPPPPDGLEKMSVLFIYRGGKLHHEVLLGDVFDPSRFTDRDCFLGPVVTLDSFDDAAGNVVIATAHADGGWQKATVNFRTGEVLQRTSKAGRPNKPSRSDLQITDRQTDHRVLLWVGLAAAVVLGAVAVMLIRRRFRRAG